MKFLRKEWKKEMMFDIRALGSEFFFGLVFIRSLIGPYFPFVYQIVIAGLVIFVFSFFIREFDGYVARGLTLGFFVSTFYNSFLFYIFAALIVISSMFISRSLIKSKKALYLGLLVGVVSILAGYFGGLGLLKVFN